MSPLRRASLLAIASAFSIACGAAPVAPVARARPSGPTPSALHATPVFFVRLDLASLEGTLTPRELESIDRGLARVLRLGHDGAELIARLDAIAASTDSLHWDQEPRSWRVVVRHRMPDARARFERALLEPGGARSWREQQGVTSTRIAGGANADSSLLAWSDPHEVVLAPETARAEVVRTLRDHAARRVATEPIEPALVFERDLIAEVRATDPPQTVQGIATGPGMTSAVARLHRSAGGVRFAARLRFESEEAARATEAVFRPMIEVLVEGPFLSALQLDGLAQSFSLSVEGEVLRIDAAASWDEVRTILDIFAH